MVAGAQLAKWQSRQADAIWASPPVTLDEPDLV
jgi:hypothetical protein